MKGHGRVGMENTPAQMDSSAKHVRKMTRLHICVYPGASQGDKVDKGVADLARSMLLGDSETAEQMRYGQDRGTLAHRTDAFVGHQPAL